MRLRSIFLGILCLSAPLSAQTFNSTGSVQQYTVPATGVYQIVAYGAGGGAGAGASGGLGAQIGGNFSLNAGTVLDLYIGQQGTTGASTGGGGGATWVAVDTGGTPSTLLAVAGGGGGIGAATSGGNATTTHSGNSGGGGYDGGGGGGYSIAGIPGTGASGGGQFPTLTGGAGASGANGGYGGGGGGGASGGGGGAGYNGGDGGPIGTGGAGGGSYLDPSATDPIENVNNTGNGYVTIALVPAAAPTVQKSFNPSTIPLNGASTLTITITNPNSTLISGVGFTDTFPTGLIASVSTLANTCGGTPNATTTSLSLSGGSIVASSSCSVSVSVTGTMPGGVLNSTGPVSSSGGTGGAATATLTVVAPPTISKAFGASTVALNGTTTLTFTLSNPNTVPLTGVAFSDTLRAGLEFVSINSSNCGGSLALSGLSSFQLLRYFSGTFAPASSCTIVAGVTGVSAGVQPNTTSGITSNEGGSGSPASASITVLSPPTISKAFGATAIPLNGAASLTFTISNSNATTALTGVGFTDTLPGGLTVPSGTSSQCGGTLTTSTAPGTITFTGGTVAASSSCTITVTVTGVTAGPQNNTTGAVTSSNGGTGTTSNTATVTVIAPPAITKAFNPAQFVPGGTTQLQFQITNPDQSTLPGVTFTDTLPTGMLVASPNNLSSTCGAVTAIPGSNTITLPNGTVSGNGSCTITLTVTAANEGVYKNVSSPVGSRGGGASAQGASATATVANPPTITKSFSALAIPAGGSATLTFTVTNPNTTVPFTGVSFTDTLPAGLTVSTPNGLTGTCDGGVITATSGTSVISLNGASLAAGATCTFGVSVTASATGPLVNVTSTITSDQTVPGATASATITVGGVFEVNYSSNLNVGDSFINITNTGENGAALNGPGIGSPAGNICVNVYAFAPDEQLISCCSCLVTPDALASLSIGNDVIGNTATGAKPDSIVVKLLATLAGSGGSGTTCSAATPGTLVSGLSAWSTTLHATPVPGEYAVTDRPFTGATLSAGELASLTNRCTAIIGNNSGAGICNSCRSGGLGAATSKQ